MTLQDCEGGIVLRTVQLNGRGNIQTSRWATTRIIDIRMAFPIGLIAL